MCGRLERRWRGFLLNLATPALLCLCLKDRLLMQQPSHVLHFQPRANRAAQFLAQEGVACFQFVSYRFLPGFSHLCSRRKSVHFVVLSLCIGCWLVLLSLTLFSVLASRRLDTLFLNGWPAIRRAQLADRFSRVGGWRGVWVSGYTGGTALPPCQAHCTR